MRAWHLIACVACLACDDDHPVPELPPPNTTVRFHIPGVDARRSCFALDIRDTNDVWHASPWYTSPTDYLRSFEGALEAGSLCSDRPFDHVMACRPGEHEATLDLVTLYEGDVAPDEWWASRQSITFDCERDHETVVAFTPMLAQRKTYWGGVGLDVKIESELALTNACFTVLVEDGDHVPVARSFSDFCTYGGLDAKDYFYCNNESQPNRLLLVLDRFELAPDEPTSPRDVINPCPPGDDTHRYWGDACVLEFDCPTRGGMDAGFVLELLAHD